MNSSAFLITDEDVAHLRNKLGSEVAGLSDDEIREMAKNVLVAAQTLLKVAKAQKARGLS